ncbi:MAG: hypothetical protein BRC28_00010 [Nanohaloarchaea archaeon SW_4_43_9]|nr:MAG: hypothetical protein BRC28_00010 [Nanohaloarchaea archaeon SW_4_43_9]
MDQSTFRLGFLVGMIGLIFLLLYRDRENVERAGIMFYRRTGKGLHLIDRIAKKSPRLWNIYAWGGILAGIISIPAMLYFVAEIIHKVISTGEPSSGAGLVYPSTGSTVSQSPGAIGVPAEYWFISIAVLMVVHELSHGIIARAQDFEINSVGVIVLGVIPGAFVEPKGSGLPGNEGDKGKPHGAWNEGDWISNIKVLAAGSWANYLTAGVFLVLAIGLTGALTHSTGVVYQAQEEYPAATAGMTNGTLTGIDNYTVRSLEDVQRATEDLDPGESVVLRTSEGNFSVTATEREGYEGGYIGIQFVQLDTEYNESVEGFSGFLGWFLGLFRVIAFLNLGIGLFNMLPAKPLDGGHILEAVVERFLGEDAGSYVNAWSGIALLSLLVVLGYSIAVSL